MFHIVDTVFILQHFYFLIKVKLLYSEQKYTKSLSFK